MKKIGFGARPSELKGRYKQIAHDEDGPRQETATRARSPGRSTARQPLSRALVVPIGLVLLGAAVAGAVFLVAGGGLTPVLDSVVLISGERQIIVPAGDTVQVAYGDGLVVESVQLTGLSRYLSPAGLSVVVSGIAAEEDVLGRDLIAELQPEDRLDYTLQAMLDGRPLGTVTVSIAMRAADWISRADALEDPAVQAQCYRRAIAVDPDAEAAHVALGRQYEREKKYSEAIAQYREAIRINPGNIQALKSLAALYGKKAAHRQDLISVYQKLAAAVPAEADQYWYEAGLLKEKQKDTAGAMNMYRESLRANRAHANARHRLIKLYERGKKWNRVAGNTQVLLEYNPKDPDLHLYLSQAYLNMGNLRAAYAAARKAAAFKSGDAAVHLQLAAIAERMKKTQDAITHYTRALECDPRNAIASNNLGMLLERSGKLAEAITRYRTACSLAPDNIGYATNLADAYEQNKQWKEAAGVYAAIVKRDRRNTQAWEALAVLQLKAGNTWKALEAYQELAALEPRKILWHQKAAELYEQLGRLKKARQKYHDILDIDPANAAARKKYLDLSKQSLGAQ